jgi:predicted metal-binding membrane protein
MFAMGRTADDGHRPRLGRDRGSVVTALAVVGIGLLAWAGVIADAGMAGMASTEMTPESMGGMNMAPAAGTVSILAAVTFLISWAIMMAAMMLPSAAPMIALYGAVHRHADQSGQGGVSTVFFALLYLLAWLLFGIPVYAAQLGAEALLGASPVLEALLPYALAAVLIFAGIYQFSPLKTACLRACQSPLGFFMARWRAGYLGTLRLGVDHALYCIGCCWALMVVLVAAGAMGLHWVLLIAALVAAEKLAPGGLVIARIAGAALILLGVVVAVNPGLYAVLRGSTV